MLTPGFELSQTDEYLIVSIQIPYAKVSEVEVHFEDTDFMFHSKPYYLRLNLPGNVEFTENPDIDFNVDKKILTVKAPKSVKGQVFEGLDLITKLLAPKKKVTNASPMIEIIDGLDTTQENDEEFDWCIEQTPCEEFSNISLLGDQCGFACSYSCAVFKLKEETQEIFDVREPQNKSPSVRRKERIKAEADHFDEDHYIADLYHDETIQDLLKYKPEWEDLYEKIQATTVPCDDIIQFTSEEKEKLRKLPNKEYILDKSQVKMSFLGLIDIMLAYAYNMRTMEGENNVESAWTVNKLSATLSWLETFSSVSDVALTFIRRSLSYPLYRHFELSVTILEDVRKMLLLGRKYIIKCLLDIHELFNFSEPRYIMNDLFITDYCVWMQTERCSSKKLVPLAEALGKVLLTKGDIGLNLVDIESFAAVAWMAHNSNDKDKNTVSERNKTVHSSENAAGPVNMEKLSLQKKPSSTTFNLAEFYLPPGWSDVETCSSCPSFSSSSSSNTCESDSDDSDTDDSTSDSDESSSESDDDAESPSESDNDAHTHLLKRVN